VQWSKRKTENENTYELIQLDININIAPLSILSEDEWGDLECLFEAYQAAITDGGLSADTGVHERGEFYERQSENDCEMKTVS